ncbi:MAG: hypothetical protein KGK03_11070 [Candidatus Omnitrophica bacterium]|nr:hypothetical protein [Candidatus Omnitrophota bacterium]
MIIGVDFDNTLVNYDMAFSHRASELGLISLDRGQHKRELRDRIRLLPDGEKLWQQLQSYVYTQGMAQARLIDGVEDFFAFCQHRDIKVYVVSHKTEHASFAPKEMNLQQIALAWMRANGFFYPGTLGLDLTQVYFESTRAEKIRRIQMLNCTHFIDDLQEVFLEGDFPSGVKKILYAPTPTEALGEDIMIFEDWKGINDYLFSRA